MTTWTEWFAYLDGRLEGSIGGRLPEVNELLRGTTRCLDRLVESAAQSHFLAASLLYSQGWKAAWLPAALPNSEESRLVKRAVGHWKAAPGRGWGR